MTDTATPLDPRFKDEAERDRLRAAVTFVHRTTCPRGHLDDSCVLCRRSALGMLHALRHLDEHPRNARGARRALHDAVCQSECGPDSDHADRTQAKVAAALRKFRAQES